MKLGCALVACNENTHYLNFWPTVRRAWNEVVGVPCKMVYVGNQLHESLVNDPDVIFFKAIEGWPTATQAQCIRLLYPAILKSEGAVILSDMDMIPLQREWFVQTLKKYQYNQFVSLRGIDENERQIYMCYVAAIPKVWGDLMAIDSEADIRATLIQWSKDYPANGRHGSLGWCTDQIILYNRVKARQLMDPQSVGLEPWTQSFPRLDRANPSEWMEWSQDLAENLTEDMYIDFHMPPLPQFKTPIETVLHHLCTQKPAPRY